MLREETTRTLLAINMSKKLFIFVVVGALLGVSQEAAAGHAKLACNTGAADCSRGIASWYGRKFQGHRTANGERFDRGLMTAAHPTLPFDTRIRVTNLANGRSVVVRVNDRGPGLGRLIDVSEAAAERLGMKDRGFARVIAQVE